MGALVADGGSILSRAAIIAREHGIPAVMGTISGTATLRTGDVVTVDGNTGRVERARPDHGRAGRSLGDPRALSGRRPA